MATKFDREYEAAVSRLQREEARETTQAPTQPIPHTEKCGAVGDAGICNLYGDPKLEFSLNCSLQKGHNGVHECKVPVRLRPTYNKVGLKTKIVTDQAFVTVQWEEQ